MSLFAADAQTKKTKKVKNSYAQKESRAVAAFNKSQMEKHQLWEEQRIERVQAENDRIESERIADSAFTQERSDWKTKRLKEIDDNNQATWKSFSVEQENMARLERERDAIVKAAKIKDDIGRQVKYINSSYTEKANAMRNNMELTEAQKIEQLMSLNNERRAKIKAIAGKNKERKLEKERREYVQNHADAVNELAWVDDVAVNK